MLMGIVTAGAACGLFHIFVKCTRENQKSLLRDSRDAYAAFPIIIDTAAISQDLVPLIDKLELGPESVINILGDDCRYFSSPRGPYFLKALERWISRGATVNYFSLSSDCEQLEEAYSILRDRSNFNIFLRKPGALPHLDTTFHPTTILLRPGEQAMWVEGLHLEHTNNAHNVKYTSPKAMNGEELAEFQRHASMFEELKRASIMNPNPREAAA